VTNAIGLAGSLTLPGEGLVRVLELQLAWQVLPREARELPVRRRGWEWVRPHRARRPRCCRILVLARRPDLLRETEA
jgi:hypothetical protein